MSLDFQEPIGDRSKYAQQFAELHDPASWERWVLLDTVYGGGLSTRLIGRQYRGIQDLEYQVRVNKVGGMRRVLLKVTGRRREQG